MSSLLDTLPLEVRADSWVRAYLAERTSTAFPPLRFSRWGLPAADEVARLVRGASEPVVAAGILAMHPSGYVREAALAELEGRGGDALVFAVARCADWVPEVRERALRLVRAVVDDAPEPAVVLSVALANRLAVFGERRVGALPELRELLSARLTDDDLLAALDHYQVGVRQACARLIVRDPALVSRALPAALAQRDPLTADLVARAVMSAPEPWAASDEELRAMLASKHPVVACAAGWQLLRRLDEPRAEVEVLLVDRRASVRHMAQEEAVRVGVELVEFYRRRASWDWTSVIGLCEVVTRDQLGLVTPLLAELRPRTREAAMKAVVRLDVDAHLDLVMRGLGDRSPRVARAAAAGLEARSDTATITTVTECVIADQLAPSKNAARLVARRMRKWPKLRVALECVGASDAAAHEFGLELVRAVVRDWNGSAAGPTREEREVITASLRKLGDELPSKLRDELLYLAGKDGIEQ